MTDEEWMQHAIRLAQEAELQGEVPVGALIVYAEQCIAEGWNQSIQNHDPSAHAEIVALRKAGHYLQNYRQPHTTLYVTLEPCVMCMGAIAQARVQRLVFGAFDPKRGAVCSAMQLSKASFLNHHIDWTGGIQEQACSEILTDFFKAKRKHKSCECH
ncbi:tRNA adenosine(34) deaminase TadA [Methylomonas sp. AM2-LC]|uniref:tRNA adenosine(34) deaminase TadA n=1 Tax=Methylomonas sp. AM2-LC TaxID=3153301 RepID=UPI003265E37C